jgi:hypothetical protein
VPTVQDKNKLDFDTSNQMSLYVHNLKKAFREELKVKHQSSLAST